MKILVTSELSHKKNYDYQGVLIQFSDQDKHYFHNKKNWMPKTSEAFAIHKIMFALDPDYRALINQEKNCFLSLIKANQFALIQLSKDFNKFKSETVNAITKERFEYHERKI